MAKHTLKILRCYERRVKKTKLTFLKSKFPGLSIQLTGRIGNIKKKINIPKCQFLILTSFNHTPVS